MVIDKNSEEFKYIDRCDIAKQIKDILLVAKVEETDKSVLYKLMQYAYNHVTNVIEGAKKLSEHANKEDIDAADVSLALKMNREEMVGPVSRNELIQIASKVNEEPLPLIKPQCGIALPSTKYCLTETNYKMKVVPKLHIPVPIIISKPQMMQNNAYVSTNAINIANTNTTVFKRSKLANMDEQKIVFRPRLKINIKTDDDNTVIKKARIN